MLDVRQLRSSPFHTEGDGISERVIKTITSMLTHHVNENTDDWDTKLPQVELAYNTAVHSTTRFSPFQLQFGRRPKLPIDLFYNSLTTAEVENINLNRELKNLALPTEVDFALAEELYAHKLKTSLKAAYKRLAENMNKRMTNAKEYHDRWVRVFRDTTTKVDINKKLSNKFTGPYEVLARINKVNYVLRGVGARRKRSVFWLIRVRCSSSTCDEYRDSS